MRRIVSSRITGTLTAPTDLVLAVTVADGVERHEELSISLDGAPLQYSEVAAPVGTRLQVVRGILPGTVEVDYRATVVGVADPSPVSELDRVEYARPSRYCDSDKLAAVAAGEFAGLDGKALLDAVSSWVGSRLSYVPGSSKPIDGAVDTYLARQGVCRDYAHLVIALLRGLNVPARLSAVYAPGLDPMDFHAVAEALVDDQWCVVDATALAPRPSLLRIATGRDAADTAFLSTLRGAFALQELQVTATVDDLPTDDLTLLTTLG